MKDESKWVGEPVDEVPKRDAGDECNGKKSDGGVFVGYCSQPAGWGRGGDVVDGRCKFHHNGDHGKGGAPERNANAVSHGAFQEHFTEHLTEGEQAAFDDAYAQLETPESAQDIARSAASMCLLQFRRSGDERFLRRFEGICDKFGIAPADELEISGSVSLEDAFLENLKDYHGHGEED